MSHECVTRRQDAVPSRYDAPITSSREEQLMRAQPSFRGVPHRRTHQRPFERGFEETVAPREAGEGCSSSALGARWSASPSPRYRLPDRVAHLGILVHYVLHQEVSHGLLELLLG